MWQSWVMQIGMASGVDLKMLPDCSIHLDREVDVRYVDNRDNLALTVEAY